MSKQNTSSAVMQQRKEAHDSLDDFPTPPWATRALMEHVIGTDWQNYVVAEPACNRGYMVKPLSEYFMHVIASDIHDYGLGFEIRDYLFPGADVKTDWTITNPPFRLSEQFILKAIDLSSVGVAMFVRSAFAEGKGRYENLFSKQPPSIIAQFTERAPLCKGRVDPLISSATAYAWFVWSKAKAPEHTETKFVWIPPCRKQLERPGDYEQAGFAL